MKIQILKDRFGLESKVFKTFYDSISKLVDCELVEKMIDKEENYYIVHDYFDLNHFDEEILSKTILLNTPSPDVKERLSKYKVAGVVESRVYFQNFSLIFGLEKTMDFKVFIKDIFDYKQDSKYAKCLKKERTEDYTLANMIVDYLKMHQKYFLENKM